MLSASTKTLAHFAHHYPNSKEYSVHNNRELIISVKTLCTTSFIALNVTNMTVKHLWLLTNHFRNVLSRT